jgi:hypothetical protein
MADAPRVYRLTHSTGTVELELGRERFVVRTKGTGLADKLRTIDMAIADLRGFALTPTTPVQNRVGGTPARPVMDASRDAELLLSYVEAGRTKKKRLFVAAGDPALQAVIAGLRQLRPDASLLHLEPREAYRRIGVLSPQQGVTIVLLVLIGVPLVIVALVLLLN